MKKEYQSPEFEIELFTLRYGNVFTDSDEGFEPGNTDEDWDGVNYYDGGLEF